MRRNWLENIVKLNHLQFASAWPVIRLGNYIQTDRQTDKIDR